MLLGECRVIVERGVIVRAGVERKVTPRSMDILSLLMQKAPELVPMSELLAKFWRGDAASRNAVHKSVTELRTSLGDDPNQPRYIQTVPRRGYRIVASLEPTASRSVALVPFQTLSSTAATASFSTDLQTAILAHVNGLADMHVFADRDRDDAGPVPTFRVVGSIRGAGSDIRVAIELIRVLDGVALLTQRFERDVSEPESAASIGAEIAQTLRAHLDEATRTSMHRLGTRDAIAHATFLEACGSERSTDVYAAAKNAALLLRRAIARDPAFLAAYVALAHALRTLRWSAHEGAEAIVHEIETLGLRVHERAPNSEPAMTMAVALSCVNGRVANEELTCFDRLVSGAGAPTDWFAYSDLLAAVGLCEDAEFCRAIAQQLPKGEEMAVRFGAELALARGGIDSAIVWRSQYLHEEPAQQIHRAILAVHLVKVGRRAEARAQLNRLRRLDRSTLWSNAMPMLVSAVEGTVTPSGRSLASLVADGNRGCLLKGWLFLALGEVDHATAFWRRTDGVERALLATNLASLEAVFPRWVATDRKYGALLNEIGLGSEWRDYLRSRVARLQRRAPGVLT